MVDIAGQTLGQYQVLQMIGQGGMARVYRGLQPALEREVAIKAIPARSDHSADRVFLDRFTVEARVIARLAHPYIVPIYDFGVDRGWAFLVMEYITSGSVRDQLARAEHNRQRVDLIWALTVLEQAALALDFAHERGVIHRDVKPGNMLLRSLNMLLLSDFGVAKMLQDRTVTQGPPMVVGTPQYMAPEQCRGDAEVDGRCDIYSLGVVLFQCATGRLPFYGESQDIIMLHHINDAPPRPSALAPGLPPHVEQIILTALQKDPARRYQRASAMAAELGAARAEIEQSVALGPRAVAGPTTPVVAAPQSLAEAPAPRFTSGEDPNVCFRCGSPNSPANRHCVVCGYDRASNRAANDRVLAPTGHPLRCRLIFRNGPFAGLAFTLHQDVTTIGRGLGNDVLLQEETVSRQHARLTFSGGQWVIEDVQSVNGVAVNGKRVSRRALPLAHGDLISFGDVQAIYQLVV